MPPTQQEIDDALDAERRLHQRAMGKMRPLIDLGFGPVEILDWSLGGARIKGTALSLGVGDFATGSITMDDAGGPMIADVVRVMPPYFDPRQSPDEISLRWLELPPGVLDRMVAAKG